MATLKEPIFNPAIQWRVELGRFIAMARKKAGLSQYYVAVLLGHTTTQTISNIERGTHGLPPKHVYTLAGALGVDPQEIISRMSHDRRRRIVRLKV